MSLRQKYTSDRVLYYFLKEKAVLGMVTFTGILYNIGMVAGPYFEGRLAQCLYDIAGKTQTAADMARLAAIYFGVILFVQAMRFIKRLYVRKFANNIIRAMKRIIYRNLIRRERSELYKEGTGSLMTKALSDADACAEGMRKFTTEVFDTMVVMVAYLVMLLCYDWRLTLISMIFPPFAYIAAELLKQKVTASTARSKESAGRLNAASLERVQNALTYRVFGQEQHRNARYEATLADYEKQAIRANIWESTPQPVYHVISMAGAVLILWFGAKNVLGTGWSAWEIGTFSTFLACFIKLANKTSKAAKLFNAVQKAEVSWKRIKPYLGGDEADTAEDTDTTEKTGAPCLRVKGLGVELANGTRLFSNVNFEGRAGQILGLTGTVASGKSTLGRAFLNEFPHEGTIEGLKQFHIDYLGHEPELLSGTIEENIRMGRDGDISEVLRLVCMDREVAEFPEKAQTRIGDGGVRLSGGQQARIALARALYHKQSPAFLILDDPFSAVDRATEQAIYENLRRVCKNDLVLLISHRLTLFPALDGVIFLAHSTARQSFHGELMESEPEYRKLYELQSGKEEAQ